MSLIDELKRRKLVQWALAYAAGAWAVLQVLSLLIGAYHWPDSALRIAIVVVAVGFLITLVLAWYHGERGEQRLSRNEMLLLAILIALGGGLAWRTAHAPDSMATSAAVSQPIAAATAVAPKKSIAVLPFVNMSGDKDNEYFSDGMSEEILNALAKVKDLKVAGRTWSFYYKGRNEDLRSIGKALGVANVLEGSVRKQGEKVRITAQLIRTDDDFHLWSETYDGDLKDVFALQERIARAITDQLQVVLAGKQAERLVNAGTENPEAYALFLQATGTFNRRDGKHFPDAIAQLTEAIRLDPNFARAHSRLAAIHAVAATYMQTTSLAATHVAAELHLQAAIKLDPGLAEPYAVLGYLRTEQRRQVEGELAFRRALELDPDDVTANFWHGISLVRDGYTKQGIATLDHVLAIDPLLPNGLSWRGVQYAYAGDTANAERLVRRATDVGLASGGWGMSIVAEARGQKLEAIKQLTSFLRNIMPGFPPDDSGILAEGIYGDTPARAKALALVDRYLAGKPASLNSGMLLALFRLGEPARALTLAPERLTGNDGVYMTLLWSPDGRAVRAAPEFQTFIHRFGLVELWDKYGAPDLCQKNAAGDYVCE